MRAFAIPSFRAAYCAALIFLLTISAGSALAKDYIAWLRTDQSHSGDYSPDPHYSFNSSGQAILIGGGDPGVFSIVIYGLENNAPGNVQVSAVKPSGPDDKGWCHASQPRTTTTAIAIDVECYNAYGQLASKDFTLLYQARDAPFGGASQGGAYLYANPPSVRNGPAAASFNSTGGTNTVVVHGHGYYTATLPGLTSSGGIALVTGIHPNAQGQYYAPRCNLGPWAAGASSTNLTIRCFNPSGVGTDGYFDLAYAVGQGPGAIAGQAMPAAWALANAPESKSAYKTEMNHQYNGFNTGRLTARKTGTGLYTVTIPGTISYSSSVALVTAVGSGSNYCNLAGPWTTNAIYVACYAQGGAPADSPFEVTLQTAQ